MTRQKCQLNYSRYFGDNIRDDYANGALDQQVEAVLEEMRELAIFGQ